MQISKSTFLHPDQAIMPVLPPVYPITDKALAGKSSHFAILRELARGGAQFVQIRDKTTPPREFLKDLIKCAEFADRENITLIVNDRCDLAILSGASGVHLGQDDLPPEAARTLAGTSAVIGLSTHSLAQVKKSNNLPIDYIGFGPVFTTTTRKDPSPRTGLRLLAEACAISRVPVVAIGGISREQIRAILRAGAASAAVISSLMSAGNIAREMELFLKTARETQLTPKRKDRPPQPNPSRRRNTRET
ncbi:MAG TPA: thiamine phosphate synthase [Acidobacteriota bacterium]|nr:thiamine phosphate synthase [Acidobacteriota bacterium]